jgi:hypothetical protein
MPSHPAWYGEIRGLNAEKLFRGKKTPYLYLLRTGEKSTGFETDFYVTFLLPDFSIKHQPFIVREATKGWFFENGGHYIGESIDEVIHLIMHCRKEECVPLSKMG